MNAPLHFQWSARNGVPVSITKGRHPLISALVAGAAVRLDSHADLEVIAKRYFDANNIRHDSAQTAAFARSLETIIPQVYEAEFAEYRARDFFPTYAGVDPGDLTVTYRMASRVGQAAVIGGGMAKDLPTVSVETEEWPSPIITLGASWETNVVEQASSRKANIAIEAVKGKASREAIEQLEEDIFAFGYAPAGVPGVTSCLGIQQCPKLSTGTWQAQIAAATTAGSATNLAPIVAASQALQGDLAVLKQRVRTQTRGKHKVSRFLLPTNLMAIIESVPQSPAFNGLSLLKFMENSLDCQFDEWPILMDAGNTAGSTMDTTGTGPAFNTRIIGYESGNPEVMQLIQAQMFIMLAPQPTGLALQVPVYSRIGGAMSIRPLGIEFLDGC
jgi:hypothetical protein